MKIGLFPGSTQAESKHYRYAIFFAGLAFWTLLVGLAATLVAITMVILMWTLSRTGLPCGLEHPELSLFDQLALLDYKSAAIFVAIIVAIFLALAAIEFMEHWYKKIEKL